MSNSASQLEKSSDQKAIIAKGMQHIAKGQIAVLAAMSEELETIYPADEADWRAVCGIFSALGRPAWIEIATNRFLTIEPKHFDASMTKARILSRNELTRADALAILAELEDTIIRVDDLLVAADIYFACQKAPIALNFLEKAEKQDPSKLHIYRARFDYFVQAQNMKLAKLALKQFGDRAGANMEALLTTMVLALSVEEFKYASRILPRALANSGDSSQSILRRLMTIAGKLGDFKSAHALCGRIN